MITREDVLHIAKLAKLKLADDEIALFQEQLGRILEYFKQLEKLDTEHVAPMTHVVDVHTVLRADDPRPSVPVEEALKNAPKRQDGYFVVPKVVEKT
jgi:aspartyl-tRNA(Asn)/glutamyl-tRNA(Gln) amidotransferase subunit C